MDTSAARRNIFARIRAAQGRPAEPDALEREQAADYLARHPAGPRPPMPDDAAGLLARFTEEAERMSTTVEAVDTLAEVPAAAARYLQARSLAARAIAWRTLADIDWASAGLEVDLRKPVEGDLVGITGCFCASAETGSLVLLSGPDTYASAALLPETHLVVVPASHIVAGHEDAFALIRAERGELPRAVNIVSGPSRTGDIEQTIILGAHGPYRVHAIIVRGA
ncbi:MULTISPECIES: lactate utilization protein C [unclassified Burkholderia]|uniref:LutC/YkgG family protein n=1 Tax=unclassified Burkholderia TaxID=2613784 RepID=UPI0014229F6F|nr:MULTISPECIES: lactate utilization protein C [unclassified Burkholderia]NIE86673.1 lactate utilization protein C [Burkholderia sp. Tr-860]NIF65142.1 lactate utilization protein C [Burkholderia sp. Cy-647]NIF95119.1 lactate utilization protein C [Burkholderia sp. Ax-1720]